MNISKISFYKNFLSFIKPLRIKIYIFLLSIHLITVFTIFNIENFNNSCSKFLPKKEFFCLDFLTPNIFFLIPDIIILGFLLKYLFVIKKYFNKNGLKMYEKGFPLLIILYILFRIITRSYHKSPVLNFFTDNYYMVGLISPIILIIALFIIMLINKKGENGEDKNNDIDTSNYQNRITTSIRSTLPKILNDIAYNVFSNISNNGQNRILNAITIRDVKFEKSNTVFVELNLNTAFINEIAKLKTYDWTLAIEARGYIDSFKDAKWRSSGGKNGLIIEILEQTIDFSKTYPYPNLIGPNTLLKKPLEFIVGKSEKGEDIVFNLAILPHLLVAGSTGGGKSVAMTNILVSLMINVIAGADIEFIIIDPKRVEFGLYKGLPGFKVITDLEEANELMQWAVTEMDRRYKLLEKLGYKNIGTYHSKGGKMSFIVIIVDEFADIMTIDKEIANKFEWCVKRISQLARAVGMHLIIATQNPIAEVITSNIKANLPSRLGCKTVDGIKSTTIIDDTVLGDIRNKGEIYLKSDMGMVHMKSYFIDDEKGELKPFIDFYKSEMSKKLIGNKGVSIHLDNENKEGDMIFELEQYIQQNDTVFDIYSSSYAIFRILLEKGGYESRSSMRAICSNYNIGNNTADKLVSNLKEKELLKYNEKSRFNFLSEIPKIDNIKFLEELYQAIYNIINK